MENRKPATWPLKNGTYTTKAGSRVEISGKHAGKTRVQFDWLEEENACLDCEPEAYPQEYDQDDVRLVWNCNHCDGGSATLYPTLPDNPITQAIEPLKECKDEIEFDGYASDISMEFVEEHCKGRPLTSEEKEEYPEHFDFIVEGKELELWHRFIQETEKLRSKMYPKSQGHHICWAMETP